jgi:hypothetical protein
MKHGRAARHAERTERSGGLAPPIVTRTRPRKRRGIQIPDDRVRRGLTPLAPTIPNNSRERCRHGIGRTKAVGGGLARSPLLGRALRRTRGPTGALPLSLLHLERSVSTPTTLCIEPYARMLSEGPSDWLVTISFNYVKARLRRACRPRRPSAGRRPAVACQSR